MFNITQAQTKISFFYYCVLIVFYFFKSSAYAHPPCGERVYREGIPGCQQVLQCAYAGTTIQTPCSEMPTSPLHDESNPSADDEFWYIGFQFIPLSEKDEVSKQDKEKASTVSNWLIPYPLTFNPLNQSDSILFNTIITKPKKCTVGKLMQYTAAMSGENEPNKKAISKDPMFLGLSASFSNNDTGNHISISDEYKNVSDEYKNAIQNEIDSVKDITEPELKVFVILCGRIESAYFNVWGIKKGNGCDYCKHLKDVLLAKLHLALKQDEKNTIHLQNPASKLYNVRKEEIDNGIKVIKSISSVEH